MRNMHKQITIVFFALCFLCVITAPGFTQKTEGKTEKKTETKTFTGTVESVSTPDPAKGTKSEIVLTDDNNKKLSFLITATTTLYSASSVPITLEKIKKGKKLKIRYTTTKEGVEKAISVRIME
jgi:hypothetical protein